MLTTTGMTKELLLASTCQPILRRLASRSLPEDALKAPSTLILIYVPGYAASRPDGQLQRLHGRPTVEQS